MGLGLGLGLDVGTSYAASGWRRRLAARVTGAGE